jgi:uncharacterized Zn-binding protein involved in type VI secretion
MPAAARVGDTVATGHLCDTATTLATVNRSVNIEGANACVVGDLTVSHSAFAPPNCAAHTAPINVGSTLVTIGGVAAARFGDSCDLGTITSGAVKVTIGG